MSGLYRKNGIYHVTCFNNCCVGKCPSHVKKIKNCFRIWKLSLSLVVLNYLSVPKLPVCFLRRAKKRFMDLCLTGTWWHYHKDHCSVPQMCPTIEIMTVASMLRAAEIREAWCPVFKSLKTPFSPRMPTFPNRWKEPRTNECRWSLLLASEVTWSLCSTCHKT